MLPDYLKRPIIDTETTKTVRRILKTKCLNTVCEGARCPNKSECYSHNTATFLIMGKVCTRNCRYCNISPARPEPLDLEEPKHVAEAVKELGLKFAVITSVTRDDLPDGGAQHFKNCIDEIRKICDAKIEILTPDMKGNTAALDTIIKAHPDVFNHNIETVRSIFKTARPQGDYDRSIEVLRYVKENSNIVTKSGLMVGLGATHVDKWSADNCLSTGLSCNDRSASACSSTPIVSLKGATHVDIGSADNHKTTCLSCNSESASMYSSEVEEIEQTLVDLKNAGVDIVTIGQYIQPSKQHLPVAKYYTLEEFEELKELARKIGFKNFQIGPLVRSSYHAMASYETSLK